MQIVLVASAITAATADANSGGAVLRLDGTDVNMACFNGVGVNPPGPGGPGADIEAASSAPRQPSELAAPRAQPRAITLAVGHAMHME